MAQTKLSLLQLELLKLFPYMTSEEQIAEIRDLLFNYYSKKLVHTVDQEWINRGYTKETMEKWVYGENQ
jgi:hypothetical protein